MEYNLLDIVWTMVAAFLVYFMQAGFAMVETGFTRAKNAGNIVMKNMMDFVIGSIAFFLIGFGLMFGQGNGIIGLSGFFDPYALESTLQSDLGIALPIGVFMIFHTVFCATAATIVSGAMAERTKFSSYLIYSACISIFIYPVTGHWIWGGGWLSGLGFHDFAGSTAVHSVGGWCALIGAAILGPRIGKYREDGKPNAIPGHNLPLGALGTFILWFCWFGFNCGSTTAATESLGDIAMTTNLAAAAATLVALFFTWVRYGKPDVSMTMNGALAGLVGITAGCDIVSNYGALAIGIICGFAVVLVVEFVDRVLKIDDPVGATGVHWACGMIGTILTGVFVKSSVLAEYGMSRIQFIGIQVLGVAAVGAFTAVMAFIIFTAINKTVGLRVTPQEELDGLDGHEHGCSAYADFQIKL
ncbi:ammonium transporter [Frisingicoccus sp.]|uniref:ammonium transporter n=1 Tax=Frisingicoccus sp. TaxID=1918627 RepID=UPI002A81F542|nr:ammonium transporter [Frisingicoccus sp.]MDY4922547.1 ammonium transporter [Frisingicoccus sp.]